MYRYKLEATPGIGHQSEKIGFCEGILQKLQRWHILVQSLLCLFDPVRDIQHLLRTHILDTNSTRIRLTLLACLDHAHSTKCQAPQLRQRSLYELGLGYREFGEACIEVVVPVRIWHLQLVVTRGIVRTPGIACLLKGFLECSEISWMIGCAVGCAFEKIKCVVLSWPVRRRVPTSSFTHRILETYTSKQSGMHDAERYKIGFLPGVACTQNCPQNDKDCIVFPHSPSNSKRALELFKCSSGPW